MQRRPALNALRALWVLLIVWYEYGTFFSAVRSCQWPDSRFTQPDDNRPIFPPVHHILLVADPQIIDLHHYPNRGFILSYFIRGLVDLNMKKNWRAASRTRPDTVIFLGDMMDTGRMDMPDEEYEELYTRFSSIFKETNNVPHYFIPGNHDIGLGKSPRFSPKAYERYEAHFGPMNSQLSLANHTIVLFNAENYADEESMRLGRKMKFEQWVARPGGSLEFTQKWAQEKHEDPVVLVSHIPMYRPDGKSCGALREKGTLRPGVGFGFQNTLEKHSTARLLQSLEPVVIFSGDDHDYCDYTHQIRPEHGLPLFVHEISVKSISMVMGVRRPGFQLLSLVPKERRSADMLTHGHAPCLLPDQIGIYLNIYFPFTALTIVLVVVSNLVTNQPFGNRKAKASVDIRASDPEVVYSEINTDEFRTSGDDTMLNTRHDPMNGLPSPALSPHPGARSKRAGWLVIQETDSSCSCGSLPNMFATCRVSRRRQQGGLIRRCARDVRDVAIYPLVVFFIINWWVFVS